MKKILLFCVILSGIVVGITRGNTVNYLSDSTAKDLEIYDMIKQLENGFAKNDVSFISPHLGSQVYLSFLNDVSGYYSSNQAYYILEKFFKDYSVISFSFDKIKTDTTTPFATGRYYYEHRGNRAEAKVYLSLKFSNNSWEITQISID
ncbi:DUF4783 domain-containing protein [bacterium BMS3Abin03]|jgi:hypothetical protein|nr:DUF4783 domain-containing protein [bacterium BMS3Abin03]MCG6960555.1 DUF4783 domain-containing protein [bacterium BMS3Abin03]